jgi:hypothetical protein
MSDAEPNPNAGPAKLLPTDLPTEKSPMPQIDAGSFEVTGSGEARIGNDRRITYERWLWRPSAMLTQQDRLPKCFCIPFAVVQHTPGVRSWYPERILRHTQSWDGFIGYAFLAGLEILRHIQQLSAEEVFSYRAMCLLFRRRAWFSEFLERHFSWSRDLYFRKGSREDQDRRTVLEVVVPGLEVGKFMEDARAAAEAQGLMNPSEADLIQIGLLLRARQDPLKLPPGVEKRILRRALFDLDLDDNAVEKALEHPFVPRFLGALEKHIGDSAPDFDKWFTSESNHSFKHLAQQKKAQGEPCDPDEAKKVMLALVWQAFTHVGNCLHTFMAVLKHKIKDIAPTEASQFDRLWLRQPVFGDLPIILFRERFQTIVPALVDWFNDPAIELDSGIVYRLLQTYSALVDVRREADRRSKDTKAHADRSRALPEDKIKNKNKDGDEVENPGALSAKENLDTRVELGEWMATKDLRCAICSSAQLKLKSFPPIRSEQVLLILECQSCDVDNRITASVEELKKHLDPPK